MCPSVLEASPVPCPICGMALEPRIQATDADNPELRDMTRRFAASAVLTAPLLLYSMVEMLGVLPARLSAGALTWIQLVLATPVVVWAGLPLLLGSLACIVGGYLTDMFIKKTGNRKWGRRLFGIIGHGLCATCYFVAIFYMRNPWAFVLLIAFAAFWNDLTMGSSWASCLDIGKRYSGIVAGCMNTVGNLGGALAGILLGVSQGSEWGWGSPANVGAIAGGLRPVTPAIVVLRSPDARRQIGRFGKPPLPVVGERLTQSRRRDADGRSGKCPFLLGRHDELRNHEGHEQYEEHEDPEFQNVAQPAFLVTSFNLRDLRGGLARYFFAAFSAKLQSRTLSRGIGPLILSSACAWSTTALIAASEMTKLSGQLFAPSS